jgi:hypothetical protein
MLGAVASLGYGLGFLPFGPLGWKWICAVTVIGGIALTCIPELILVAIKEMDQTRPNQTMKPTAPLRYNFSVFATTPCRGLSLSP